MVSLGQIQEGEELAALRAIVRCRFVAQTTTAAGVQKLAESPCSRYMHAILRMALFWTSTACGHQADVECRPDGQPSICLSIHDAGRGWAIFLRLTCDPSDVLIDEWK